jgi:hypothetical protein
MRFGFSPWERAGVRAWGWSQYPRRGKTTA